MAPGCAARYRARDPRATPLYRLFETHFDEVRGQWEERFERRCGFWRAAIAAQLGEKDRAVDLLAEAFSQGREYSYDTHINIAFEPLWDYPPFQELIEQKG